MINQTQVEELNQKLLTEKALAEHVEAFRMNEPFVFSWMSTHAKTILASMAKKKSVDNEVMTNVYENICRSYMFTYFLFSRNRDHLVEKMLADDQFGAFLAGKLDDKYYQYDTEGMPLNSELVMAKNAHRRIALQNLRKRLIPLIAEDVGMGRAPQTALRKVQEMASGKA